MKNTDPILVFITTCLLVMFFCGCASSPGTVKRTSSSEFGPGTILTQEIDVTKTSEPLTDADRVALLRGAAADADTNVVPQSGRLDIFFKGCQDKSYSYIAGKWFFREVVADHKNHVKISVMFYKDTNPFERTLSPLNEIVREDSTKWLSVAYIKGVLDWAKTNNVTIFCIEDSLHSITYALSPRRFGFEMTNERNQVIGEYDIKKNAYVEANANTKAGNTLVTTMVNASPTSSPCVLSASVKTQSPISSTNKASSEAQMREVLRGYKIGVTTQKQCMNDVSTGSWKMSLGGMGLEVLSQKVTLSMIVGIGDNDICDLVFEGDDPQQKGKGKTPDFDQFLLKKITFKP